MSALVSSHHQVSPLGYNQGSSREDSGNRRTSEKPNMAKFALLGFSEVRPSMKYS